jgi:hypothetical protein
LDAEGGRDVDDHALISCDEARKNCVRKPGQSCDVERDLREGVIDRRRCHGSKASHARIVHQHPNVWIRGEHRLDADEVFLLLKVGCEHINLATMSDSNFLGQRLKAIGTTRHED